MTEETIRAATLGCEDALKIVSVSFNAYIRSLSWDGNSYNEELEGEMRTALLLAVLKFKIY